MGSPSGGVRFEQKVCLVTGAASGIGLATARLFASEGARVVVVDINEAGAREAAAALPGSDHLGVGADVSDPAGVARAVEAARSNWGRIDVLVNNAAIMTFDKVVDLSLDQWEKVMAVNLRSVFLFTKLCLPLMKGGAIVNVSSVHAHDTTSNVVPYASSKGGMEAFCRALSQEIPAEHARINCVAPGAVDTPMLWNNPNVKSGREKIEGRIGTPEEIAGAIAYLASDEALFVNGTTLMVDGGRVDKL